MFQINKVKPIRKKINTLPSESIKTWKFGAVVLLIHGVADPISTYLAVIHYQVGVEANPVVANALNNGELHFLMFHIPLYVVIGGCLAGFTVIYSKLPEKRRKRLYQYSKYVWWGLICWGTVIVGSNLYIIAVN